MYVENENKEFNGGTMRKIKLVIPLLPVSLNTTQGWFYHHDLWRYNEEIETWDNAVMYALMSDYGPIKLKPIIKKANITIKFYFETNRARDKDNYAGFKPLLDALKGRVIQDDRDDWVKVDWELLVDRDNPRTEIIVEERG